MALLVPAAMVLYLFRHALFRGGVFFERDVSVLWYPQAAALVRSVANGSWPVWNPRASFGEPQWAFPSQVPYPPTWLHLLVMPWTFYTLSVVAHAAFGACGMYCLLRRLGVSRLGACTGATAWVACGPVVSVVNMLNLFSGAAWLPWMMVAADVALGSGRAWHAFLWGLTIAMPVLAGSEAALLGGLMVALYTAVRAEPWRRRGLAGHRRLVSAAFAGAVFAMALGAAQWLPTWDLTRRTARGSLPEDVRTHWSAHPIGLLQLALPVFPRDLPLRSGGEVWGEFQQPFLFSLYLGVPMLALAAASTSHGSARERQVPFFLGLGLLSALIGLGRHAFVYPLLAAVAPPLRVIRFPVKAFLLVAFCMSVLAGIGVDAWRAAGAGRQWSLRVLLPLLGLLALTVAALLAFHLGAGRWGSQLFGEVPGRSLEDLLEPTRHRLALAVGMGCLTLGLAVLRSPTTRGPATAGMAALLALDLALVHGNANPTASKLLYQYRPALADAIPAQARICFRERDAPPAPSAGPAVDARSLPAGLSLPVALALAQREYLLPSIASTWGLLGSYETDIKGVQTAQVARLGRLLKASEGTPLHLLLLRLGAVQYVVALDREGLPDLLPVAEGRTVFGTLVSVFQVPDPLPRTYVVSGARVASDDEGLRILTSPDFDPSREVILSAGTSTRPTATFRGSVRVLSMKPDEEEIEAVLDEAGHLVVVEAFDRDWRVTLDGRPAGLVRANLAFRGVAVPAGRHRIRFRYRPPSVMWGMALTGSALTMGVFLGLRDRITRRA